MGNQDTSHVTMSSPGNSLLRVDSCDGSTDELQQLAVPFADQMCELRETNSLQVFEMARKTLITLLSNIVKTPSNEQFRTIHLSNQAIQRRVLAANGSLGFLAAAGFVQLDETLVFVDISELGLLTTAITALQQAAPAPQQAAPPPHITPARPTDPKREAWLAEMKAKKQKEEAEKAALRARIAAQREEQKHKTYKGSKAVKGGGSWQTATEMGLDGKAGG